MERIKAKTTSLLAVFECNICAKCWIGPQARLKGYEHARKTLHYVTGKVTTDYAYALPEEGVETTKTG